MTSRRKKDRSRLHWLKELFAIESKPRRGLVPLEWAVLVYLAMTLVYIFFTYDHLPNVQGMLEGRLRIVATMLAMWVVYRLVPCRFTMLVRCGVQIALLGWWYPDTYEMNRILPNLDHHFAQWEQALFGFQPALVFAARWSSHWFSELMSMGYAMYYPMIALVLFYYFFRREHEFQRAAFIVMASFFIYYIVFVLVPVVGPTFYYHAVGVENIAHGLFPPLGHYFNTHTACLPTPGYHDGLFYQMVEEAKSIGERPTAAFPSSHVGVSTICLLLACRSRCRWLTLVLLPVYVCLCFSTVYIQAHYALDAIAGLVSGVIIYALLLVLTRRMT